MANFLDMESVSTYFCFAQFSRQIRWSAFSCVGVWSHVKAVAAARNGSVSWLHLVLAPWNLMETSPPRFAARHNYCGYIIRHSASLSAFHASEIIMIDTGNKMSRMSYLYRNISKNVYIGRWRETSRLTLTFDISLSRCSIKLALSINRL